MRTLLGHRSEETGKLSEVTVIFENEEEVAIFLYSLQRCLNTWPECDNRLKELADNIEVGYPRQDYNAIYKDYRKV